MGTGASRPLGRSEHDDGGKRTLTFRSRQTLQDRDWRFGAFLTRESETGCCVPPIIGARKLRGGIKGRVPHPEPTTRQDLGEPDFRRGSPSSSEICLHSDGIGTG